MTSTERVRPATIHHMTQGPAVAGHPAAIPRPRKWKTRVLLPGAILAGAAALFLAVGADSLRPALAVRVAPVVAKRAAGTAGATVQASGWLEPAPFPTHVAALVAGVVEEVLVLEGDAIEAGQVVAQLIDDEARLAVQLAEAELGLAQAELAAAEAHRDGIRRANELLIDLNRDVRLQASRVAGAEAALVELSASIVAQEKHVAMLRDQHTRTLRVQEGGAASEGEATQQGLRVESAESVLEALRLRRAVLEATREQARAEERAARRHLETLVEERRSEAVAVAQAERARASVARAEVRLADARLAFERHEVRALTAGVVMRRLVAPGARVMLEGDGPTVSHVLHTYQPDRLQVRVDVPLADAAKVGPGQQARVDVETLPERSFAGHVVRVVHQADVQKNTVEFKVELDDRDPHLKPDMLARVRFLAREAEATAVQERLFVPADALTESEGGGPAVWVARTRQGTRAVAERRSVQLGGARSAGAVEVVAGLQVGDEVVVRPPADLSEGALLSVHGEAPAREEAPAPGEPQ